MRHLNVGDTEVNGRYMNTQASDGNEEPHALFMKNEPDLAKRRKAWNAKTPEQRDELSSQLEANDKAGRIPRSP